MHFTEVSVFSMDKINGRADEEQKTSDFYKTYNLPARFEYPSETIIYSFIHYMHIHTIFFDKMTTVLIFRPTGLRQNQTNSIQSVLRYYIQ